MTFPIIGIDISRLKFDLCLLREHGKLKHKVFSDTASGFAQFSAWLEKQKVERAQVCMEATGTYGEALATDLFDAGHRVSIINPAVIKAYARSRLPRTKTDKVDATLIAQFCLEREPAAWSPPPGEVSDLQALVRRLESLSEMHQMEVNRLDAGVSAEQVRGSPSEHIAHLTEGVKRTESLIRDHIDQHPTLREQRELLVSIPGIGNTTAAKLLAGILDVKLYRSARQLAAFARLVPRLHESGSSIKRKARLSKTGAPRLRKALSFPALAAIKYNPSIKAMSERLRERGKCPMQIIGAAMRKLVHIAYGVLKSGKQFNPEMKSA